MNTHTKDQNPPFDKHAVLTAKQQERRKILANTTCSDCANCQNCGTSKCDRYRDKKG